MLVSQQNIAQKQQDIIQAAKTLFLSKGYSDTSMDSIAVKAGVTKQTVYRYYPAKEALFSAVMKHLQDKDNKVYQFTNGSLKQELLNYGNWLLEFHLRPEALGLYKLMLTEGGRNKKLLTTFQNTGPKRILEPLQTYLQPHYRNQGKLPFVANMFCTMVLSVRNKVLMGHSRNLSKEAIHAHVTAVVEMFLPMIR